MRMRIFLYNVMFITVEIPSSFCTYYLLKKQCILLNGFESYMCHLKACSDMRRLIGVLKKITLYVR